MGKETKRDLGTRSIAEAQKRRDIILGDIRRAEEAGPENTRFSIEAAKAWAEDIRKRDAGAVPRAAHTHSAF